MNKKKIEEKLEELKELELKFNRLQELVGDRGYAWMASGTVVDKLEAIIMYLGIRVEKKESFEKMIAYKIKKKDK